jgi:hypothetical protein
MNSAPTKGAHVGISRHVRRFRRCRPCLPCLKRSRRIAGCGAIIIGCLRAWLARNGCVTVHHETYYLSTQMAGQLVALVVDAPSASFDVMVGEQLLKRLPIKGVVREEMLLERFISLMLEQARSEERLRQALKTRWQRHPWDPTRVRRN